MTIYSFICLSVFWADSQVSHSIAKIFRSELPPKTEPKSVYCLCLILFMLYICMLVLVCLHLSIEISVYVQYSHIKICLKVLVVCV